MGTASGLVLLLPHGYEGQGPEHSSARIERFLTLCARDNMRLAQPTTAAQYFHLLRSQVRGVGPPAPRRLHAQVAAAGPPVALAHRRAGHRHRSADGASTTRPLGGVAGDRAPPSSTPPPCSRVLLCSGKVAFDAMARPRRAGRREAGLPDPGVDPAAVAVVRVEQLYPWPEEALGAVLGRYPGAEQVVWVQEEPENMGAWSFAHGRLHRLLRDRFTLTHVSRTESASPATGSAALHQLEQEDLLPARLLRLTLRCQRRRDADASLRARSGRCRGRSP